MGLLYFWLRLSLYCFYPYSKSYSPHSKPLRKLSEPNTPLKKLLNIESQNNYVSVIFELNPIDYIMPTIQKRLN